MYFNWFLYLFTKPAILTAAKTKIIFILIRNSNMHGDLYDGVLFNRRYQTREPNEHQAGNVRLWLVICPGYQQSQQFHPNICISHDENPSRSESPSDSSGSGSEKCKQTVPWEATKVKILISAYTTKKIWRTPRVVREKICMREDFLNFYWTLQNGWHWKFQKFNSNKGEVASTIQEIQSNCWQQQKDGSRQSSQKKYDSA